MAKLANTNKWLLIAKVGWSNLLADYELLVQGKKNGYGHMREEDIRSYLFSKIIDVLRERREWLIDLHAEQPLLKDRADIVLGMEKDNSWIVGIEIKRSGDAESLRSDLAKLKNFLEKRVIKIGVFVAIASHSNMGATPEIMSVLKDFNLEGEDREDNNYYEIKNIKGTPWDSLFLVLRNAITSSS